jgi:hypothetical protein
MIGALDGCTPDDIGMAGGIRVRTILTAATLEELTAASRIET